MPPKLLLGGILLIIGIFFLSIWVFAAFEPKSGFGLLLGSFVLGASFSAVGIGIVYDELDS